MTPEQLEALKSKMTPEELNAYIWQLAWSAPKGRRVDLSNPAGTN